MIGHCIYSIFQAARYNMGEKSLGMRLAMLDFLAFEAELIAVDTDAAVTVYIGSCPGSPHPDSQLQRKISTAVCKRIW